MSLKSRRECGLIDPTCAEMKENRAIPHFVGGEHMEAVRNNGMAFHIRY